MTIEETTVRYPAAAPQAAAVDLHDQPKRCKERRYLLAFFASLHERANGAPAAARLESGTFIARFDARHRPARSEFAATFNRLTSDTNTERMLTLTKAVTA